MVRILVSGVLVALVASHIAVYASGPASADRAVETARVTATSPAVPSPSPRPHPAAASVVLVGVGLAGIGAHRWVRSAPA